MSHVALITGISGFIGGALARRLIEDGWRVHAVIRARTNFDKQDALLSRSVIHVIDGSTAQLISIMDSVKPDVVFHLASLFLADHSPDQVRDLVESNILFPTQILEAMVQCGCSKLVNTGTSWQHYHTTEYRPVNLYAATKQAYEDIIAYYHDAHAISCITLKLFDTYGPGDKRRKLINILIDAVGSGQVLDMSPGEQIVDLTYIDDVVNAFIKAQEEIGKINSPINDIYFVSGERFKVKELVGLVEQIFGTALQINFGGRPYRPREVMEPVTNLGQALPGWSASRHIREEIYKLSKKY